MDNGVGLISILKLCSERLCEVCGLGTFMASEHLSGYQARDYDVVDYQMYQHPQSGLQFRGPQPDVKDGNYISCLGAAQTFGCFCQTSVPEMLSDEFGLPVFNFGYGGAGPAFFARQEKLLETVNAGRMAVVQIMSGRSESNDRYESGGLEYLTDRATGERMSANAAYEKLLAENPPPVGGLLGKALRVVHGPKPVRDVLSQTRANWIASYEDLLSKITVPVVLVWISKRKPGVYRSKRAVWWWQRYDGMNVMFGEFPQLVNQNMVDKIKPLADGYAEAVTERGSPQPLFSRFTGEPVMVDMSRDRDDFPEVFGVNEYYPSPEMLEDTAERLIPVCREILAAQRDE